MHIDDIEAALENRRFPLIEAAFACLVQWPSKDPIEGAEDADELGRLLDRITAALEARACEMPADLVASILERSGDGRWLRDDRSYAAGARAVAARAAAWRKIFVAMLTSGGHDPSALGPLVAP